MTIILYIIFTIKKMFYFKNTKLDRLKRKKESKKKERK